MNKTYIKNDIITKHDDDQLTSSVSPTFFMYEMPRNFDNNNKEKQGTTEFILTLLLKVGKSFGSAERE